MASHQASNSKGADGRRSWKTSTYRPAEDGKLPPRARSRSPPPRRAAPLSVSGYDARPLERREVHDERDRRDLLERERRAREELDRRRQQAPAPMYAAPSPIAPPIASSRDPYRERPPSQAYDPRSAPPGYTPSRSAYEPPMPRREFDDRPPPRSYDDYQAPSSVLRQYDYVRPSTTSDSTYGSAGYERLSTNEPNARAYDPYYPPSSYPPYDAPRSEPYGRAAPDARDDYAAAREPVRDLYSREPSRRDERERGRRARSPIPPRQDDAGAPVTEQEPVFPLEERKRRGPCKRYPRCFQGVACAFWHEDESLNTRKASEKQESLIEKGKWQNFSKQRRSPSPSAGLPVSVPRDIRDDVHTYASPPMAAPARLADRVEPVAASSSSRYSERDSIRNGPAPTAVSERGRSPIRAPRPDDRTNFYADLDRRRRGVCRDYPGCFRGEQCLWWHEDEKHNAEVVRNGRDPREMGATATRESERLGSSVTRRGGDRYAPPSSDRRDERPFPPSDRRDDRRLSQASHSTRTDTYIPRDDPRASTYQPPPSAPAPAPYLYDEHMARSERPSYTRAASPPRSLQARADVSSVRQQSEAEQYRLKQEDRRRQGPCKWYPGCHRGRECIFWHEDEVYNELKFKEKREREMLFDKQREAPLASRNRHDGGLLASSPPRSVYEADRRYEPRLVDERDLERDRMDWQTRDRQPVIRDGRMDRDGRMERDDRHYMPSHSERARLGDSTSRRRYDDDQSSSNGQVRCSLESRKKRGVCRYYPTCYAGEFCRHYHPDEDLNTHKAGEKKESELTSTSSMQTSLPADTTGRTHQYVDRYVPDPHGNSLLSRIGRAGPAREDVSMEVEQVSRSPQQDNVRVGGPHSSIAYLPPPPALELNGSRESDGVSGSLLPAPVGPSVKRESPSPDQNKSSSRPRASDFMFESASAPATTSKASESVDDLVSEDATMRPTSPCPPSQTNGVPTSDILHESKSESIPASLANRTKQEEEEEEAGVVAQQRMDKLKPNPKAPEAVLQPLERSSIRDEKNGSTSSESKQTESKDAQMAHSSISSAE